VPHTSVDLAALRQRDRAAAADLLPARRAALAELTPQTVVCPCEDITLADAAEVLDQGPRPTSLRDLKLLTRLAMGECQGRGCAAQVVRWAAATGRQDLGHGALRPRVPVVPLRLGSVVPASDVLPDQQQE
jgi:hypothetical protein